MNNKYELVKKKNELDEIVNSLQLPAFFHSSNKKEGILYSPITNCTYQNKSIIINVHKSRIIESLDEFKEQLSIYITSNNVGENSFITSEISSFFINQLEQILDEFKRNKIDFSRNPMIQDLLGLALTLKPLIQDDTVNYHKLEEIDRKYYYPRRSIKLSVDSISKIIENGYYLTYDSFEYAYKHGISSPELTIYKDYDELHQDMQDIISRQATPALKRGYMKNLSIQILDEIEWQNQQGKLDPKDNHNMAKILDLELVRSKKVTEKTDEIVKNAMEKIKINTLYTRPM